MSLQYCTVHVTQVIVCSPNCTIYLLLSRDKSKREFSGCMWCDKGYAQIVSDRNINNEGETPEGVHTLCGHIGCSVKVVAASKYGSPFGLH